MASAVLMIKFIKLTDFRNFKSKSLEFSNGITVISGPNASGKTNILESLFLLSTGRSFKAKLEIEMIKYGQELARIGGSHFAEASRDDPLSLEVMITEGRNGWPKKRLLINGVPKRMIDFAGNFKTVLFGPWDMDLVTGSPSLRRKFLDTVLSQVDREYRRSILSYEKGIRQRNRLLFRIREENVPRSQLAFWNQLLIKNGNYITECRREFIEFVNVGNNKSQVPNYKLEYDASMISEGRLEQYKDEEIAAATTLVGPHRDDFIFLKDEITSNKSITGITSNTGRELASYGSRGEQRMGILWLKMAELSYIETNTGEKPTLLLDDIFSELDEEHREVVLSVIGNQQTIITTADDHFVKSFKKAEIIKL
jgi:DNA replication and repair protein RecF